MRPRKDKYIAALLAFFVGTLGVHRFYLREPGMGIVYLILTWFPIPAIRVPLSMILSFVDAFRYLTMDQRDFDRKYNQPYVRKTYGPPNRRRPRYRSRAEYQRNVQGKRPVRKQRRAPSRRPMPKYNPYKKQGIKKFNDYDLEGAIEEFTNGLKVSPKDVALHFNLACAYSLSEMKDKAFHHLSKATEFGFKDHQKIHHHDALAFIRIQKEFETFVNNGYSLKEGEKEPVKKKIKIEGDPLLSQLKKLKELREKGAISEQEFLDEKKKLMK